MATVAPTAERRMIMRPIDADRALEIVRDQVIAHPNAYHLTNYATLILREAPTLTNLSKYIALNSTADGKPQTNADRIRAMTDEELLGFLMRLQHEAEKRFAEFKAPNYNELAEWLKQPAE